MSTVKSHCEPDSCSSRGISSRPTKPNAEPVGGPLAGAFSGREQARWPTFNGINPAQSDRWKDASSFRVYGKPTILVLRIAGVFRRFLSGVAILLATLG